MMEENKKNPLELKSLRHIGMICRSAKESMKFYRNVLGFVPIRRPDSLDFAGNWLLGYGFEIHMVQSNDPERLVRKNKDIDPSDYHLSFQCENMGAMENKLRELGIKYKRGGVGDDGKKNIEQLYFHDPDGFMIEICNCDDFPVVPLV